MSFIMESGIHFINTECCFNRPDSRGRKSLKKCVSDDFSTFWRKATFTQSFCSQRWNSSSKMWVVFERQERAVTLGGLPFPDVNLSWMFSSDMNCNLVKWHGSRCLWAEGCEGANQMLPKSNDSVKFLVIDSCSMLSISAALLTS